MGAGSPFGGGGGGGCPASSSPFRKMGPLVGLSTPVTQLKRVLLPAPLGPMMARSSPRGTVRLTLPTAVRPPKRMVSPSVRRIGSRAPRSNWTGAPGASAWEAVTRLRELARGRNDRLFLRDDVEDLVLHVADFEEELAHEGLMVLPAKRVVALR